MKRGYDKMDFIDQVKQFSKRVEKLKSSIQTEEATKTSLIMPFFQLLGYDVFNPEEFVPEFTADVGIKKGEKVDYAIYMQGVPVILVEAKWCGDSLNKHSSQLFRYFGTTKSKFGILTNGIVYCFYTDLEELNKMDLKPFFEFDLLDIRENKVAELKKFHKDSFDAEIISSTASELKYINEAKILFTNLQKSPDDAFIKYVLSNIYEGLKTQSVIDRFNDIIKKAFNEFINEFMNDKITSALKTNEESKTDEQLALIPEVMPKISKIETTEQEMETFYIVKTLLRQFVPYDKITYKDTESYFSILFDNNMRKWICRIKIGSNKITLILPEENKIEVKYTLATIDEIYNYSDRLQEIVSRYIK